MRRLIVVFTSVAFVASSSIALADTAHSSQPNRQQRISRHQRPGHAHPGLQGIPSGAPAAAYRKEPTLPKPGVWPFSNTAFPRTSGSGRLLGGADFWSDFLYDDDGAAAAQGEATTASVPVSTLAPTQGTFTYAAKDAHGDGADIFRAGVGETKAATYWRVDWLTLANRNVPIAEWTFDTDDSTSTGATAWPANAGVNSPGIDKALVVSAKGAELLNAKSGKVLHTFHTHVSMKAKSFIVRIPKKALRIKGIWRVRLAAGIADKTGKSFANVSTVDGREPGQPNVYNVTFRTVNQEPPVYVATGDDGDASGIGLARGVKYGNYWMEADQANALAHSDVSAFSLPIDWSELAHHDRTPVPQPTGYSARWYISPLHLGQGVIPNPTTAPSGDLRPNYLGDVQPYSVYVPTNYDPKRPMPLTWILHSLSVNYNQYGALDPATIQQECEDRDSICATTEGFGPDGWYFDEAEVDFWDVWHQLAKTYTLDPQRTVLSGYSMGGWAAYKLGLAYPDLFAKAMALAGPPGCGIRLAEHVGDGGGAGHCDQDGDSTPMLHNARWLPYILGDGAADELVPITSVLQQVQHFVKLGLRIHFELYPAEDHLVFATQDGFSSEISQLGVTKRTVNPGTIDYSWYPALTNHKWGIGPTGDYWVRGIAGRKAAAGEIATINVKDGMRPLRVITVQHHYSVEVPGDPTPAKVMDQTWKYGKRPARRQTLSMTLTDVSKLGIDLRRAKLHRGTITVRSDGRTMLRLLHASRGSKLFSHGRLVARAKHGQLRLQLGKGTTKLLLRRTRY